ncbi:MAG: hypothetical protein V3W18_05660 [candidate division Zixibacteria bacterium]
MNPRNLSIVITLVLVLVVFTSAQDKETVLTNEQVVAGAVRDATLKSDLLDGISDIHLVPVLYGIERPFYSGLVEAMSSRGITILSDAGGSSNALGFVILGFEFSYNRGESRGLLLKPFIKRRLDARIRVTLQEVGDGKILRMEDISFEYSDEVGPELDKLIKSPDIPELAPKAPGSYWSKIVEPIVVTAAVGGLVYLFFENR